MYPSVTGLSCLRSCTSVKVLTRIVTYILADFPMSLAEVALGCDLLCVQNPFLFDQVLSP